MTDQNQYKPGDIVNGHVLTSAGTWQPLAAPPMPTSTDGYGAPTPLSPVMPSGADRQRRSLRWLWITLGVLGGLFLLFLIIGLTADGSEVDDDAAPGTGSTEERAAAPAADEEPPAVDPAAYAPLDAAAWAQVAKDPEAARGQKITVFAEVTQFDSATGTGSFRANVGATQPAGEFELETNSMLDGDAEQLSTVTQGDVLKVYAEVTGSLEYETMMGGATVVPALSVAGFEVVGYLDITGDVQLGGAVWGEYGGVDVPVAIVNSANVPMSYSVDIVAENTDGTQQFGSAYASADNLAPGQSTMIEASFFEDLPADVVIKVVSVERYSY